MKKHLILLSMIAALALSGCNFGNSTGGGSRKSKSSSSADESGENSNAQSSGSASSGESSSSSSWIDPYVPPEEQTVTGDNFTITIPADLSSMSANCKQYVDDMRAQQRRLIAERGENADYYLNDLFGANGVDLTKGVLPSERNYQDRTGGYRDGSVENNYLDNVAARWEDGEKSDENKGINITFTPSAALQNKTYIFTYGKKADLSDGVSILTTATKVNLKNLLSNQKYYFKVAAEGQESAVANFTTGDYPRWINARPMFNVRDHGGYMTSSGQRIKQGLIYRGGEITPAVGWKDSTKYTGDVGGRYTGTDGKMVDEHITTQTESSKAVFRDVMGMVGGIEIDLRSSGERNNYNACGFANGGDISYSLISISSYASGMQSKTREIKQVFEAFAQADQHPVYYHCYGGADRTGVVGFMLGALLGMSYTDLVIDFELTSYSSNPSRNYRSHLRNGPWNEWPGMVTYLKDTLGWGYGSGKTMKQGMEDYLKNNCGVSQTTIDTIRNIMLEPAE